MTDYQLPFAGIWSSLGGKSQPAKSGLS